jgi:thiosulfate/3-mercaptopyruvate sulfurtransferase
MFEVLISVAQLQSLQKKSADVIVFDCSFDLTNTSAGHLAFEQTHIAGARYADLDEHLSQHGDNPQHGRHPLPDPAYFANWLASQGVNNSSQVVVYDRNGCNFCGRLWWLMKWAGHDAVAVLDGGLSAWQAAGGALAGGPSLANLPGSFQMKNQGLPSKKWAPIATNSVASQKETLAIIDARAAPRYRGEVEPLDPVAGHIPGALNRPFQSNFTPDGLFKPAAQLREEFTTLLADQAHRPIVHHCGSGVSALPNLIAMAHAGLNPGTLYAGSWSAWCNTPGLPVARG